MIGDERPFRAVIFDLDGVLVDAEIWWDEVRMAFARRHGRTWTEADRAAIMGANSRRLVDADARSPRPSAMPRGGIEDEVVDAMVERYAADGAPLHPGRRRDGPAGRGRRCPWPSPRRAIRAVIAAALDALGIADAFAVGRLVGRGGRTASRRPDVYLLAATRLGVAPERLPRRRGLAQRRAGRRGQRG